MNCEIHGVPFENKTSKLGKPYQGHFVAGEGMCFPPKKNGFTPKASEPVREPVKETDWDEVARGKIRSLFIQSHIQRNGLIPLSASDLMTLDALVEVAMGNK